MPTAADLAKLVREASADDFARMSEDALLERIGAIARELAESVDDPGLGKQLGQVESSFANVATLGRSDRMRGVAAAMRLVASLELPSESEARRKAKPAGPSLVPRARQRKKKVARKAHPKAQTGEAEALPWRRPPSVLPGIGPKIAERFARRGLENVEDLAHLVPVTFVDQRRTARLDEHLEGTTGLVRGVVRKFRQGFARGRYMATMEVEIREDLQTADAHPQILVATWFHANSALSGRVSTGEACVLVGSIRTFRGRPSMVHPEISFDVDGLPEVGVRYPNVEGMAPRSLRRACLAALEYLEREEFPDPLPDTVRRQYQLLGNLEALRRLHEPGSGLSDEEIAALSGGTSEGHRRLAFEELFLIQLHCLRERKTWTGTASALPPLLADGFDREALRACLPFEPTAAQWRVMSDIEADLSRCEPMLRLLQGDVGAGKTVVAFAAAVLAHSVGGQTALMAPTEILAEQHHSTLSGWCRAAGLRIACLTGSTRKAERNSTLALVREGAIDLIVGTHALIVEDVAFSRLGLVIVDEQHRFGVDQRAALRAKGETPHLLVMTATPIPRSLALTAYGELEVSVIDELPPGRTPPETRAYFGRDGLDRARAVVCKSVARGVQAFVVCPLVEASEHVASSDVEATAVALREQMPDRRIEFVHGRMTSVQKDEIMTAFRSGAIAVLVATTVIEVGVDIPGARVILVEHAERFGLAQLHQLRGRVGRSGGPSLCLLHTAQTDDGEATQRLRVMTEHADGFAIAQHDLEARGPGEMFGTRQSGAARLRHSSFGREGMRTLTEARAAAQALLDVDPELASHPRLQAELDVRAGLDATHGADAG